MADAAKTFDGILCDIDGTLTFRGKPIEDAADTLQKLRRRGCRVLLTTNITARSPEQLAEELRALGFAVERHEILTTGAACAEFLRKANSPRCRLLVPASVRTMLAEFDCGADQPDFVVLGDLGTDFSYDILNAAFQDISRGAQLLALQRGLFWFDGANKRLDVGAFVLALESATRQEALVVGKPSKIFFDLALEILGTTPDRTLVVGDDYLTDIRGAQDFGMSAAWVASGKSRPDGVSGADVELHSLACLPAWLDEL